MDEPKSQTDEHWIKTTCAYCGVGCGLKTRMTATGELEIKGDESHPANYGRICVKGLNLKETIGTQGRLTHPTIDGEQAEWQEAIDYVAQGLQSTIEEYGKDSVAFYVSGQLLIEDYYIANKFMKGFIGSNNIDTNSRLCMASTVAGQKRAFGADIVPGCYEDLEHADLTIIVGSNTAWCHPVLFQRICAAKKNNPRHQLIVIDPKSTETSDAADQHLALQAGSDLSLFQGLFAYLVSGHHHNTEYLLNSVTPFDLTQIAAPNFASICEETGLDIIELIAFYSAFAQTNKVVTLYSQGINQSISGTDKVNSIINCHLLTGKIGQPGMGPLSLTGQPNAMGGREVGGLANALAAHFSLDSPEDRDTVAQFWGSKAISERSGRKAVDLFNAIESGDIKAVWIIATNPAVSLPESKRVQQALEQCPLVIVSDCMTDTVTTHCASVCLPAQGWGEKSGTVTNSERRISRQRRILPTLGDAKPDWWILCEVAKAMGFSDAFHYENEADIFQEYAKLTTLQNELGQKRTLYLGGVSSLTQQEYDELLPQQWPILSYQEETVSQRCFGDGVFETANHKANLVTSFSSESPISTSDSFVLNTGRLATQWHTMTRTGLSQTLMKDYLEPRVWMNTTTAEKRNIKDGDWLSISNDLGDILMKVALSLSMKVHDLFIPIHWSGDYANRARVNEIIKARLDPISGQPAFKQTKVNVHRWHPNNETLLISRQPLTLSDDYIWSRQTIKEGFLYRIAYRGDIETFSSNLFHGLVEKYPLSYLQYQDKESQTAYWVHYDAQNTQCVGISQCYAKENSLAPSSIPWLTSVFESAPDDILSVFYPDISKKDSEQ